MIADSFQVVSHFALSFGAMLALMALIAAWLFRTAGASLWLKVILPSLMTALACSTPFAIGSMLGYPVGASFDALPDRAELVGFVARDDNGLVDLWLRTGDVPRAYETKLDAKMKKALREARDAMAQGRRPLVAKAGKAKADRAGNPNGIGDDEDAWVVDPDALSRLPGKK